MDHIRQRVDRVASARHRPGSVGLTVLTSAAQEQARGGFNAQGHPLFLARRKNFSREGGLTYDVVVRHERNRSWLGSLLVLLVIVSLTGRLHIIWNGAPRFMLIDDLGVAIRLVIDDAVVRSFGGPQGLNQKRVTIKGERVSDAPEVVRVSSIKIVTENN